MASSTRPPVTFIDSPRKARRHAADLAAMLAKKFPVATDTEFDPDTDEIDLMSYSWDSYGDRFVVEGPLVPEFYGEHLVNPANRFVYQNYGADADVFYGINLQTDASFYADTMVMGWLVDENLMSHGLKEQAFHFLKWRRTPYDRLFAYVPEGKKTPVVMKPKQVLYDLPPDALKYALLGGTKKGGFKTGPRTADEWRRVMLDYSGDDAASTHGLYRKHRRHLKEIGYWDNYLAIDRPFTLTLMRCEERGVRISLDRMREILRLVNIRIMRAQHGFRALSGKPDFNLNSDPQLKKLMLDELNWPTRDDLLTPSGYPSLGKEAMNWYLEEFLGRARLLERKASKSRAPEKLQRRAETYRRYYSLALLKNNFKREAVKRGTFLEGIINGLDPETDRLHSHFNQIGADCLAGGELVWTRRGYIPVEQVTAGDVVFTHEGRARRVSECRPNGIKAIYRVTLYNGLTLRTTGNHPYYRGCDSTESWTKASDLSPGDHVWCHATKPEEWRRVQVDRTSWNYQVSSWGRVRNYQGRRPLALSPKGEWGHLKVTLSNGKDRRDFAVHRLVACAFVAGKAPGLEVRHLNGIAWDNRAENLAWGTSQDNSDDSKRHGTHRLRASTLNEEVAAFIRAVPYRKNVDARIAEFLCISREHARDVRLGKRWRVEDEPEHYNHFTEAKVVSVEVEGREMTYALTIDEDHSHVTGGIVTHNTGRISSRKQRKKITVTYTTRRGEVKTREKQIKVGANLQNIPSRKEKDPDGIRGAFEAPLCAASRRELAEALIRHANPEVTDAQVARMVSRITGDVTAHGYEAQEDYTLIVADYSGFELCMAIFWLHEIGQHKSKMLKTMQEQKSPSAVHALTAMGMYGEQKPSVNAKNEKVFREVLVPKYGVKCRLKHLKMEDWKLVKLFWPDFYGMAKNGNFNLLYGGSPQMMARLRGQDVRDPEVIRENEEFVANWNHLYPEIGEYQDYMVNHGYEHGWVPTISGRRANVKELLESEDKGIRSHGERKCMNTPCQGSAADIVKVAMNLIERDEVLRDTRSVITIRKAKKRHKAPAPLRDRFGQPLPGSAWTMSEAGVWSAEVPSVALLFPVHDEIVVEAPLRYADQVMDRVVHLMKQPFKERFPFELDVEAKHAPNWLAAKG